MPLNPDDTLLNGQYRILRLLGRGGFGFVYQAQDTLLRDEVAIKELIPALVGDEATLKRFLAEARATIRLAHEHIVRTHNVFQEGGNYYIVMECMAGNSLEDRLREEGALPIDEALRITAEVCAGLEHAHRRGIVHCDLKPANILFTADGTAKVADFGIAHVSGEMLTRSWNTPAGFAAGTLPYMSPEQTDGLRDDPRVDVYAMGAVLYRMLTGRTYLDFDQRETPGAQADNVLRIRNADPVPPSTHNRRVPAWLDEVVLKTLSKRPEERYDTAAAMQSTLERQGAAFPAPPPTQAKPALAPLPTQAEPAPAPPPTQAEPAPAPARPRRAQRPRTMQRPAWFWPVVGVAGVLLIATVVVLWSYIGGRLDPAETRTPGPTSVPVVKLSTTSTPTPTQTSVPPTSTPTPESMPRPTTPQLPTTTPSRTATARPTSTPTKPSTPTALVSTATDTPVPVTSTPVPSKVPRPSVGGRIAFDAWNEDSYDVFVVRPNGTGLANLTAKPGTQSSPLFSPSGEYIAFGDSGGEGITQRQLYIIKPDGSGLTRITPSGYFEAWSPDSARLVFEGDAEGSGHWWVYLHDVTSGGTWLSWDSGSLCMCWSPDNRHVLASSGLFSQGVFVLDSWGQESPRHLADTPENTWPDSCSWSPDGNRIALLLSTDFVNGSNDRNLYVMNSDGTGLRALSSPPARDGVPAWSSDGTQILFASVRDGNEEIYLLNPDKDTLVNLTNHRAGDTSPAWSPEGDYIAFVSDRNGSREIFIMKADGTGVTQVTHVGNVRTLSWGP